MATALDVPLPTVVQYDRVLAEAGLRSKGGRGQSAARVKSTDAANLLLAILGSPVSGAAIKVAAKTCRAYGRLPLRLGGNADTLKKFKRLGFPTLAQLPEEHTLRDGLSAIIEAASQGECLVIPDDDDDPMVGPANDWFVSLQLDGPTPWAEINADASIGSQEPHLTARFVYSAHKASERRSPRVGDLHQSRNITFKTFRRIGELLATDNI